jgi:signal transduction histidine kinase
MAVTTTRPSPEVPRATVPALAHALQPGVVLLDGAGEPLGGDGRALALLGCRDGGELAARWAAIRQRLQLAAVESSAAAPPPASPAASPGAAPGALPATPETFDLPPEVTGGRPLRASLVRIAGAAGGDRADGHRGHRPAALLLQDAELAAALESDLRAASQMRSLAQITPAVAHDLRAPINAMVLNLEVLKETLAAAGGGSLPQPVQPVHPAQPAHPPAPIRDQRGRQQRYVAVLREELSRLHQSLELFLAHIAPRADRLETLDLRGPAQDLAALLRPTARKQQAKVEALLPEASVPVLAHRYQLRLALLHFGLAALELVPRDGTLEVRLDRLSAPPRARLRIAAAPLPGETAASPASRPAPRPEIEPHISAAGTEARLSVARGIVASFDGTSRPIASGAFVAVISGVSGVSGGTGIAGIAGGTGGSAGSGVFGPGSGVAGGSAGSGVSGPGGPGGISEVSGAEPGGPARTREIPAYEIELPLAVSN